MSAEVHAYVANRTEAAVICRVNKQSQRCNVVWNGVMSNVLECISSVLIGCSGAALIQDGQRLRIE